MVERNSGARKCFLNVGRDATSVAVGGNRDGPTEVHLEESGTNVLSNRVSVTALGDLAVLNELSFEEEEG